MFTKFMSTASLIAMIATPVFADPPHDAFDVAEDHTSFSFAPAPVDADGMPAHGNPFVTQGYIYPAGTLSGGEAGVLENGDPAYPAKVLGTWTCDGWFVGDAMRTTSGTWLISRQVFEFKDGDILISQGPEKADIGESYERPITGATGVFAENDGDVTQTLLGFTEFMGVNVRFELGDTQHSARIASEKHMSTGG
ncbi:hypothetical protein [Litoreibacter roseus]|uniref:Uncharacterized protein n=1 Tax=Litoreibacter roseus TaxID=2601869 RepID=A0A6N6JLB7_9RHOB|nr:hypothetical protein [Litoreibacter roseus]GFE66924.1 hypothetical protein KIN_39980 [Litoreibacter roseus]